MNESDFIPKSNVASKVNSGSFTWKSPSNIALVKYWGKSEPQLPKNPSISFTLEACNTITTLEFKEASGLAQNPSEIQFEFFFEGARKEAFKSKIRTFFERIYQYAPYLTAYEFIIKSSNSFPHSSGIASSASSMSALALCIMSMEEALFGPIEKEFYFKKASFLARLGSGSACRSIKGPIVEWGKLNGLVNSSDLYGIELPVKLHHNFRNYQDTILLVDEGEKKVSSTLGHQLMENHPFAGHRFQQANEHCSQLIAVLQNGDLTAFTTIVEKEALSLHAMMMTSDPYFILMKPNTIEIIHKIWEYREKTKSSVCFTLDAGANVHVLYPANEKDRVLKFITSSLIQYCQENRYICDAIGSGATTNVNF